MGTVAILVNLQADLSLCWPHRSHCRFCHALAHLTHTLAFKHASLNKSFSVFLPGDMTSRLTSDTTTMSDTLGLNLNIFLRNVIKAIGVVFFMFKLSWRMSIVTLIGLPCIMAVSKVYGKKYKVSSSSMSQIKQMVKQCQMQHHSWHR